MLCDSYDVSGKLTKSPIERPESMMLTAMQKNPMLQLSKKRGKAIREIPMLAFRKPKSLKDYLVRAKVQKQRIKAEGSRSSFFLKINRNNLGLGTLKGSG